ncbi:mandelate racemase/muconate lactonizing enzyme family protein [Halorussus salinisoli]|uniref:mandelate racemase/muconate lactonizing enzyme family protein n=1 Tax=Halorussus salinisoli TaxID=2558242 RepID=UPI0010C1D6B2|nr:mandelate racemase/muconate lactonizing enzyme family protein [Halorussus salinisoli]
MEIANLEAIPLSHELPDGRSMGSVRGKTGTRFAALIRAETKDGLVGWGEAFAPPQTVATLVDELLADAIVGTSAYEVESLAERSYTGDLVGYHFGGSAFVQSAISGIDMALWDLKGKASGEPIHRLLGSSGTHSVVPYASTGYVTEWEQDIREPLEQAAEEGFDAAKIKIGRGVEDDVHRVAAARDILGDDADLMVDFNGNLRPKQAIRAAKELAEFDLTWIEEPVPPENLSGYKRVQKSIDVPLAAGEAHYGRFEFKRLIDERAVDIVQPNLGRVGGLSEARLVADMAKAENVAIYPHVWNSAVGVAAALQFAISISDYPHAGNVREPLLFEFDRSENPLRHGLIETPFDPTGGELEIPQKPGLGIEIDENAVERYRID